MKGKAGWEKDFNKKFGTFIDCDGYIGDGDNEGVPLDFAKVKAFIRNLLASQRKKWVGRIEKILKNLERPPGKFYLVGVANNDEERKVQEIFAKGFNMAAKEINQKLVDIIKELEDE